MANDKENLKCEIIFDDGSECKGECIFSKVTGEDTTL